MSDTIDRRENAFLRWLVGGLLAIVGLFGGIVWSRTAGQVDRHADEISALKMQAQRLELDAVADRRASSVSLAGIQSWLQAIGQRLNVPQPAPIVGSTP